MSLHKIFTYWEGPKPEYIGMCQDSLNKHCRNDFEIFNFCDCHNPNNLKINHKVDVLKANLVLENGGFWIDADMIVMQSLLPLIKLVERHGFIGFPGFFGAKKGNRLLQDWVKAMDKIVSTELSFADLIQPLLSNKKYKGYQYLTREMSTPIWHTRDEFWKLFKDLPLKEYVTKKTYVFTLYNSQFSKEFKEMSREAILEKDWLISKVFRESL